MAQLDQSQRRLEWSEKAQGVGCHILCYEVWASSVDTFSTYAPITVSGQPIWSLFGVPSDFEFFKVRAVVASDVAVEVSRSAWSNVVRRVASTATPMSTSTTGTTTLTTHAHPAMTLTTSTLTATGTGAVTAPPSWEPTTFIPVWEMPPPAAAAPGGPPGLAAQGVEGGLRFAVPPAEAPRYSHGGAAAYLRLALAAMLNVDSTVVHVLTISAAQAQAVPAGLQARRLQSGTASNTGALNVKYIVLCATPEERRAAAVAVEAVAQQPQAEKRFFETLRYGGFNVAEGSGLTSTLLNREWSSAPAQPYSAVASAAAPASGFDQEVRDLENGAGSLWWLWPILVACVVVPLLCLCVALCKPLAEPIFEELGVQKGGRRSGGAGLARNARTLPEETSELDSPPEVGKAPNGIGFDPRKFDPRRYMTPSDSPSKAGSVAGDSDTASDTRPLLRKGMGGPRGRRGHGNPLLRSASNDTASSFAPSMGGPLSTSASLPPPDLGGGVGLFGSRAGGHSMAKDWAALQVSAHHLASAASHTGGLAVHAATQALAHNAAVGAPPAAHSLPGHRSQYSDMPPPKPLPAPPPLPPSSLSLRR